MKGTDKRFADAAFNAAENAIFDGRVIRIFDDKNIILIPGFVDMHVHFRQPGFCYKETIKSGSLAAASAGYTTVCTMPNLSPAPDCAEHIEKQLEYINSDGVIGIIPYSCITKDRRGISPVDFGEMIKYTRLFSDDGSGVQSAETAEQAMKKCAEYGGIYAAHCEVNELLLGGYIHDGQYARTHGHRGISSESEYVMIERDIELVRKTNCRYHVCHISTKEGVELVRKAKADGLPVTCETAPHYLILCDDDLQEDGRFKMNPPLRSSSDREALINGIKDGTIDVIATDHAPHSKEEKSRGLEKSLMGITGLEAAFPMLYTYLVKAGVISLELLLKLMCYAPSQILGIPCRNDCFAVIDLDEKYKINSESFISMGKSTPFDNYEVFGKNLLTVYNGNIVWQI